MYLDQYRSYLVGLPPCPDFSTGRSLLFDQYTPEGGTMPPESPGSLIGLNLEWNNLKLECQVDRYDSGDDYLYVSWSAIRCPEYYEPFSDAVAYVWVPQGRQQGYTRRSYRARVNEIIDGFEWRDSAPDPYGSMLILTLPLDYMYVFPGEDAPDQSPVDFKATEDGRMALYWWLNSGRFTVQWQMEERKSDVDAYCKQLRAEASKRSLPPMPVHIDRCNQELKVHSHQPPVIHEPPEWHRDSQVHC